MTKTQHLIRSLAIIIVTILLFGIFGILVRSVQQKNNLSANQNQPAATTTIDTPPTSPAPVFIDRIPEDRYNTLTLQDLPSFQDLRSVAFHNNKVYVADYGKVLVFDATGKLIGMLNPASLACGTYAAVMGNSLFIACAGKGIYEVDLPSNAIIRTYDATSGLKNLENFTLASDGTNLWVGTFNGVAKISPDHKVTHYTNELGHSCSQHNTQIHANGTRVWAQVTAHADCAGGLSLYNATTNTWTAFDASVFGAKDTIYFTEVAVTNDTVFVKWQEDSAQSFTIRVQSFDYATNKWKTVKQGTSSQHDIAEQRVAGAMPQPETYAPFAITSQGNTYVIGVRTGNGWFTFPLQSLVYYDISVHQPTGTYYLYSNRGIETYTKADAWPRIIIPRTTGQPYPHAKLLWSSNNSYLIAYAQNISDFDGTVYHRDVLLMDLTNGSIIENRFNGGEGHDTGVMTITDPIDNIIEVRERGFAKYTIDLQKKTIQEVM